MAFYQNPHAPSCPWHDITVKHGAPNIKWCEETLCAWISEPANTWSNLSYLFVGFIIVYLGLKNRHNFQLRQYGPIILFMGASSFFYHLSNFYTSQVLDFIGMFFMVGWALGMNLIRLGKLQAKNLIWFNLGLGGLLTVATHLMYLAGIQYQLIILFAALAIVGTEIMARKIVQVNYKWYFISIVSISTALSFSYMDHQRIWCHPTHHGWFSQGHALWHWVGAVAMLTIYLFYSQPALNSKSESI